MIIPSSILKYNAIKDFYTSNEVSFCEKDQMKNQYISIVQQQQQQHFPLWYT